MCQTDCLIGRIIVIHVIMEYQEPLRSKIRNWLTKSQVPYLEITPYVKYLKYCSRKKLMIWKNFHTFVYEKTGYIRSIITPTLYFVCTL